MQFFSPNTTNIRNICIFYTLKLTKIFLGFIFIQIWAHFMDLSENMNFQSIKRLAFVRYHFECISIIFWTVICFMQILFIGRITFNNAFHLFVCLHFAIPHGKLNTSNEFTFLNGMDVSNKYDAFKLRSK